MDCDVQSSVGLNREIFPAFLAAYGKSQDLHRMTRSVDVSNGDENADGRSGDDNADGAT